MSSNWIARRSFLTRSAYGLAGLAPAHSWAADRSPTSRNPAGSSIHRTSRSRPSGSSTSAWPAGRRTSRRFDYKPELKRLARQAVPRVVHQGPAARAAPEHDADGPRAVRASFTKHGKSGQEISDLFPHIGTLADDICIVRSMQTEQINHDPAHTFMNTGSIIKGRPSMGSWLLYGLGAETENLPGFVVLTSRRQGRASSRSRRGSGRPASCPASSRASSSSRSGDAVHYIGNPPTASCQSTQRRVDRRRSTR